MAEKEMLQTLLGKERRRWWWERGDEMHEGTVFVDRGSIEYAEHRLQSDSYEKQNQLPSEASKKKRTRTDQIPTMTDNFFPSAALLTKVISPKILIQL